MKNRMKFSLWECVQAIESNDAGDPSKDMFTDETNGYPSPSKKFHNSP